MWSWFCVAHKESVEVVEKPKASALIMVGGGDKFGIGKNLMVGSGGPAISLP